jgi:hypothetical protein
MVVALRRSLTESNCRGVDQGVAGGFELGGRGAISDDSFHASSFRIERE